MKIKGILENFGENITSAAETPYVPIMLIVPISVGTLGRSIKIKKI